MVSINSSSSSSSSLILRASIVMVCLVTTSRCFNVPLQPQRTTGHAAITHASMVSRGAFLQQRTFRKQSRRVALQQSSIPLERPSISADKEDNVIVELPDASIAALEKNFSAPAEIKSEKKLEEKGSDGSTVLASTMSLAKVIVGTGILTLPYGVAAVSDYPVALLPATALLVVLGAFSAYTFHLYGRLTHETQAKSMGELWERTKGKGSSWIVSLSTFNFCFGVTVAYSLVIGDFLSKLAMSFGSGVPALLGHRQFWILGVTLSTLAPLCNLKSLAALAPMSIVGTTGSLLTALFMAVRCPALFAGSPYSMATGAVGKFAEASLKATPALAPQFNTFSQILSPASLILAAMAATAYLGHFNAVDFYHGFKSSKSTITSANTVNEPELAERKMALKKYGKITGISFGMVTFLNVLVMSCGFLTFGGNSAGVVLNNYATADRGAVISRLLMTLSVIGGYPFMVRGCKSTFVQLYNDFKGQVGEKPKMEKWVGRVILGLATSISLVVKDAGLVIGLNGAIMGSAIIYIFPALMFLSHTSKQIKQAGGVISRRLRLERMTSRFLVTFGTVSGLLGAGVSLVNSCAPHLLH